MPINEKQDQPISLDTLNNLNRTFFGRISTRDDIYLTQTMLNDVYCVRLAVGAALTEETHIRKAFAIIEKEAQLTLENWKIPDVVEGVVA